MYGSRKLARVALTVVLMSAIAIWLSYHRADIKQHAQRFDAPSSDLSLQASSTQEVPAATNLSNPADAKRDADKRYTAPLKADGPHGPAEAIAADHLRADSGDVAIVPLTSATLEHWRATINADCHGQGIADCRNLLQAFSRTLQAEENLEDGWSGWMEGEILNSLRERARVNRFTQIGAKCDDKACVFLLVSTSAAEMFGGPQNHDDFTRWLRTQAWNGELHDNRKLNGDSSTLAWEVYGLSTQPYYVWYVVTKQS